MTPLRIIVRGRPQTQGNHRTGRAGQIYDSNPALKAWRATVGWAAKAAMRGREMFRDSPLVMDVVFYVPRGGSKFDAPIAHQLGDVSKMVRAVEDSLTGVIYDDDSRIVRTIASKQYATHTPGAVIEIRPYDAGDRSTVLIKEVG